MANRLRTGPLHRTDSSPRLTPSPQIKCEEDERGSPIITNAPSLGQLGASFLTPINLDPEESSEAAAINLQPIKEESDELEWTELPLSNLRSRGNNRDNAITIDDEDVFNAEAVHPTSTDMVIFNRVDDPSSPEPSSRTFNEPPSNPEIIPEELHDTSAGPSPHQQLVHSAASSSAPLESQTYSDSIPIADTTEQQSNASNLLTSTPFNLGNSLLRTPRLEMDAIRNAQRRVREMVMSQSQVNSSTATTPNRMAPPAGSEVNTVDEEENTRAAAAFSGAKRQYIEKQEAGTATFEDEVVFLRLEAAESARLRRCEEDARWENLSDDYNEDNDDYNAYNNDSLFMPASSGRSTFRKKPSLWDSDKDDDQDDFGEGPSSNPRSQRLAMPRKSVKNKAPNGNDTAATLRASIENLQSSSQQKKRGRPKGSTSDPASGKPNKRRRKEKQKPSLVDVGSLLTSNVFKDAALNEGMPEQPTFTETRKREALKKLIASVPQEKKKSAQLDRNALLEATKAFVGKGSVRADGAGGWLVKGMKTSLKHYQLLGAAFMRDRELGEDEPKGGICADAMGFGKSITALANFVNDIPPPGEPRPTLIITAAPLVSQWVTEVSKHVKRRVYVTKYIAGSKTETDSAAEELSNFDIVITNYYEVTRSYPKAEIPMDLQTSEEKSRWWNNFFEENKGTLHRVYWNRVIADEGQTIRNASTRGSLGCRALQAKKRWVLSGTPIMNSFMEFYAIFKFLRVPYTGSLRVFKENYGGEDTGLERLNVMLHKFMIRRTHTDLMFGTAILRLPKAEERIHWCKFNTLERQVYEIVKRRMIQRVNSFAQQRTLKRNYSNVLTMLLRLRQMTSHILMVEIVLRDLLERDDIEKIRQLAEVELHNDDERAYQIAQLRKILATSVPETVHGAETTVTSTLCQNPVATVGSSNLGPSNEDMESSAPLQVGEELEVGRYHGLSYNFNRYLQTLHEGQQWEELQARTLCCSCGQLPENPYVTSCFHIFCYECLQVHQHEAARQGKEHARCLECACEYNKAAPCGNYTLESVVSSQGSENEEAEFPPTRRWKKKKGAGSDDQLVKSWIEMSGSVLPSAKTIAIKAQVLNWIQENPNVKIIIYSQFLSMIRILQKICMAEKWTCVLYHGNMSIASRDRTVEEFKKPEIRIMLASLKCGGLGLNLTMASKVISTEPWWNRAIEDQAFCRVFRIGQQNETALTRFCVENSIDSDMINMQDRKQTEIDRLLGDNSKETRKKLSIQDLMRLFGPVEEGEDGQPFILVEDKETRPRFNADNEDGLEGDEE